MLHWSGLAYRQKRSLIDNHHTQGTEVWVRWWQRVVWTPAKQARSYGGLATDLSAGDGGAADGGECGGAVAILVPSLRTLSAH